MFRSTRFWIVVALAALAWGYRGLLGSYFLRDDFMWLFDSEAQIARPIEFLTTRPSGYFRPFANVFFGLEHMAFGLDPRGYFGVNVFLHGWNALWLGVLVRAFGGSQRMAGAALLVAVSLTAAAPGVVWISGLVSLLAIAMTLPTIFFYHSFLVDGRRSDYLVALVCLVLAVCSRESGVLAGVGVLVLEFMHAQGSPMLLVFHRAFWKRMLAFAVVGGLYVALQLDFVGGGVNARGGVGSPVDFFVNVITSLPALLRAGHWRLWFSFGGGLAVLAAAGLVLGVFRRGQGIRLLGVLLALLMLALLPTYPLLSSDVIMANRYRYEASLVIALLVAVVFDALPSQDRLLGPCAWIGLISFVAVQLEAMPRVVTGDERFAVYAAATRLFVAELEDEFGQELEAGGQAQALDDLRIGLVGVPVENLRHLRSQLGVWYGFPFERIRETRFALDDRRILIGLKSRWAGYIKEFAGCDEVWVWTDAGLVRGENPLPSMRKNWRKPGRASNRAFVQVLVLPRLKEKS